MLDGLVDSQGEVLVGGDVIQRVPIIGQARHHVNVRIGGIDLQIAGLSTLDQDICAEPALDEPLGRHDMLATERIEERAGSSCRWKVASTITPPSRSICCAASRPRRR